MTTVKILATELGATDEQIYQLGSYLTDASSQTQTWEDGDELTTWASDLIRNMPRDLVAVANDAAAGDLITAWIAEHIRHQYTVQIEASNADGTIWQALHPSETVEADTAEQAARDTAANQTIADGDNWRMSVWLGVDADTGTRPDYIAYASDLA